LTDEVVFCTVRAMACKLRVQYAGAMYHVMNRGDRREAVFADDQDRHRFLETSGEASERPVGGCMPIA
jgi:hypothetical protein